MSKARDPKKNPIVCSERDMEVIQSYAYTWEHIPITYKTMILKRDNEELWVYRDDTLRQRPADKLQTGYSSGQQ